MYVKPLFVTKYDILKHTYGVHLVEARIGHCIIKLFVTSTKHFKLDSSIAQCSAI